jgi:hypothetical protein
MMNSKLNYLILLGGKPMKQLVTVLVVLGMILSTTIVIAMPSGTWVSGITVQNLDSADNDVSIDFYKPDGTKYSPTETIFKIPGNSSKTWYLPTQVSSLPGGFIGSAVVNAALPVAAIVNTQLPSGSNPMRLGTSVGISTPSSLSYAPQVMRNYYSWNSYCAVQNTSNTTAANIIATIYDKNGTQVDSQTVTVPASSHYIFDQSTRATQLGDQFVGSAKFSSDPSTPIAAACNFFNSGTSAGTSQFMSYNPMSAGGDTLYIPRIVKDFYGFQSGTKVQNIGTEALDVTVDYNFGGTHYTQTSPTIGIGQSWGPYMGDLTQIPANMAAVTGSGSALVVVNNPNANKVIIGTVNEENRTNDPGKGSTYEMALATDAANNIVFPQITSEYYGFSSGMQVSKVEAGTATCTAHYSASGTVAAFAESFTLTDLLPVWQRFAPDASGMTAGNSNDNYNGAVTINCTGAKVIGISNMSFRPDRDSRYGLVAGDTANTIRGITY